MPAAISRRDCLTRIGAWGAATLFPAASGRAAAYPRLRRGLNLHHLLNWPEAVRTGAGVDYVWPAFAPPRFSISDGEFRRISAMGFDFVRLTADPAILAAAPEARRPALREHIDALLARLLASGLNVVFDLHPVAQNPRYAPKALTDPATPDIFDAYLDVVEQVAEWLSRYPPGRVALEPMNEPLLTGRSGDARWRGMLEKLCSRALARAPRLALVVNGVDWDGDAALERLDAAPFAGDGALHTFHYYQPHTFTLQGVENDTTRFISGLGWPFDRANAARALEAAGAAIAEAELPLGKGDWFRMRTRQLLDAYETEARATRIGEDFDRLARWAGARGIARERILLGEFGCVISSRGVPLGDDRLRWLRAVRAAAETAGFAWAYWSYKGYGGMELVDAAGALHTDVLASLGLTAP